MPVWRLQCSWQADSPFPRDRIVITPHFNDSGLGTDPQQLCDDLADALKLWAGARGELTVKAYDAQGTPPVFPQGEAHRDVNTVGTSAYPRELAVCLSFYADRNLPRQRGRLYISPTLYFTGTVLGVRPAGTLQSRVADLVPIFSSLGGVDVDWAVYSRREDVARKVTHWWVDNEWDVQRSRGLRPDDRLQGSTSG